MGHNEQESARTALFTPGTIGKVEVRNRIVFQPHFTALGTTEGMPSLRHVAYHEERARGGVGLIVFESQAVHPTGKMSGRFVHAWDPAVVPNYRTIADAVHRHGAKIFGQLTHGGHTSLLRPPAIMWAPSQMPEPSSFHTTKAMDLADIRATVDGFATAAVNAREGGFDGVEIKVAHDGLLRSFASPFFNRRTDRYGGSFENRLRISVEVIEAIKKAAGDEFPVGIRLCLHEYTPWGYGLDYGLQIAAHLEATGCVDYFNSDAGSFSSFWMEIPPMAVAQGSFRELNRALKRASCLPVIAFGRIKKYELASEILAAGEADYVGFCRQLITDPETPNKMREGRLDEIRYCIACNDACVYQVNQDKPIRCIHNPDAGNESAFTIRTMPKADPAKRIVVVGGGLAGLKVAETAARRGHDVVLFERSHELGGQVLLAARQPYHAEIRDVTRHLELEVARLGVDLRLDTEADPDLVRGQRPDVLVVATGSEPNLPPRRGNAMDIPGIAAELGRHVPVDLPGIELDNVFSADDILAGNLPLGRRVLVVDGNGHWEAAGTIEYLLEAGFEVEVVTQAAAPGINIEGANLALFQQRTAKLGLKVSPFSHLLGFESGRARVANELTGETRVFDVDAVVPVIGRRSREDLFLKLAADPSSTRLFRLERVGDCVAPRLVQSIVAEAYALGRAI